MASTPIEASASNCINTSGDGSTVVRLPTAPRRKVQQHQNRATRAAKAQLPRHPAEFMFPGQRKAMRLAKDLHALPAPSVEMELLLAILAALDDDARIKVLSALAPRAASGRRTAEVALTVFRTSRMTVGEALDLDSAMRRLRDGEV